MKRKIFTRYLTMSMLMLFACFLANPNLHAQCGVSNTGPVNISIGLGGTCGASLNEAILASSGIFPNGDCAGLPNVVVWYDDDTDPSTSPSWGGFLTGDELVLTDPAGVNMDCNSGVESIYITFVNNGNPSGGHHAPVQLNVTVTDATRPVINVCPPDQVISACNAAAGTHPSVGDTFTEAEFTALGGVLMENCGILDVEVTMVSTAAGDCPNSEVISVTYVANDVCGNVSNPALPCTQTWTYVDSEGPMVTCPSTLNIEGCTPNDISGPQPYRPDPLAPGVSTETTFNALPGASVSDNCMIQTIRYIDVAEGTCPIVVTRTYTVTDACDNESTCQQIINIDDSTDPMISCPMDLNITGCSTGDIPATQPDFSATPASITPADFVDIDASSTVSDNCTVSTSLVITYQDAVNNALCGTVITRTFTAEDDCGNTSTCVQMITIEDTADPAITCPPAITVEGCDQTEITNGDMTALEFSTAEVTITSMQFTDEGGADTDDCDVTITYQDAASGSCPIVITRTYTVTDVCMNSSTCTQTINIDDITEPVISMPFPANIMVEGCMASDITSHPMVGKPLSLTIAPMTVAEAAVEGFVVTDDCDFMIEYRDAIITTGACPNVARVIRQYFVEDACGNRVPDLPFENRSRLITVQDNTAPVINSCPEDKMVNACMASEISPAQTALAYSTAAVTITVAEFEAELSTAPMPAGSSITEACDFMITYQDVMGGTNCDATDPLTVTRTFTVSDACNTSTCEQVFTIADTEDPMITCPTAITVEGCTTADVASGVGTPRGTNLAFATVAQTITLAQFMAEEAGVATASDNCNFEISYIDVAAAGTPDCPANMVITRTFTVEDDCGNTATCEQTITLEDTTDPTAVCQGGLNVGVNDMCQATILAATLDGGSFDNCSSVVTFEVSKNGIDFAPSVTLENNTDFTFPTCPEVVTLTLRVTDECGNSTTCTTDVSVTDATDPVAVCPAVRPIIPIAYDFNNCEFTTGTLAANSLGDGSSTDNCTDVTETNLEIIYTCNDVGIRQTTLFAEDECGNTNSTICDVEVMLDIPPVNFCNPELVCMSDLPLDLNACLDNPMAAACGFWTGDVITETGMFGTAATPPGSYSVTFTLYGGSPGCNMSITKDIDIAAPQDATPNDAHIECSISASGVQNLDDLLTDVSETAEGGTWAIISGPASGALVAGNNLQYSEAGCYVAEYTFPAVNFQVCGTNVCEPSAVCLQHAPIQVSVLVSEMPQPSFDVQDQVCWSAGDPAANHVYPIKCNSPEYDDAGTLTRTYTVMSGPATVAQNGAEWELTVTGIGTIMLCKDETLAYADCGTNTDKSCTAQFCQMIEVSDGTAQDASFTITSQDACPGATVTFTAATTGGEFTGVGVTDGGGDGTGSLVVPANCEDVVVSYTLNDPNGCTSTYSATIFADRIDPVLTAPMAMTVECDGMGNTAALDTWKGTATATDDCSPVVTSVLFNTISDCGGAEEQVWEFTATDACGNTDVKYASFTIVDTTDPTLSAMPADMTFQCAENVPAVATVTASDICDSTVDLDFNEVINPLGCPDHFEIIRTWTATDDCDNSVVHTQTITINDTTDPVLVDLPTDLAVSVACSELVPDAPVVTATDNCIEVIVEFNEQLQPGTCPNSFVLVRTWTATDACGNNTSAVQTITVEDDVAPTLSAMPANVVMDCSEDVPAVPVITASDNCGDEVVLLFNETIQTGTCPNDFTITRTWTAEDDCGNSVSHTQTIRIEDTEAPVLAGVPANASGQCSEDVPDAPTVTATDNCGDEVIVLYTEEVQPGDCENQFVIVRTWTAEDDCGNAVTETQTITIDDTEIPVVTAPAGITVTCADISETSSPAAIVANFLAAATATDNCSDQLTISHSLDATVLDVCAGGVINVTWTAEDECGNLGTGMSTITVTPDTEDPALTVPAAALALSCADISETSSPAALIDAWLAEASATDNCDTDPELTHDFDMGLLDVCAAADYDITVTWTATDACDNSTQATQVISITVDGEDPVVSPPMATLDLSCVEISETSSPAALIDAWLAEASASDNCDTDPELSHDFDMGVLDICALVDYSITVTWTAEDECGRTGTATQLINIDVDDEDPTIIVPMNPLVLDCDDISETSAPTAMIIDWLSEATVMDNCDEDPVLTHDFDISLLDVCAMADYDITVTWTAVDHCNNDATATQIITIEVDDEDPMLTVPAADLVLDCGSISETSSPAALIADWLAEASASDNCDEDPELVHDFSMGMLDVCAVADYSITVTWTATDACGNTTVDTKEIDIMVDNVDPVFTTIPTNITFDCGNINENATVTVIGWLDNVAATDNCDEDVVITHDYTTTGLDVCDGTGTSIEVTWTATDACGNTATTSATLTVTPDIAPPVFTVLPQDLTLDCGDINETTAVTLVGWLNDVAVSDLCDTDVTLTHDYTATSLDVCTAAGSPLTVTWTATDACDNTATATAVLTITPDTAPPVFDVEPMDLTLDCGDINETTAVTISGWLNNVAVSDLCDTDVVLTHDYATTSLDLCTAAGSPITVTWTATDACNNVSTRSAVLTITPDTAPPVLTVPAALALDCGDISSTSSPAALIDAWLAEATVSDLCDTDPTLTHNFDMGTLDVCAAADYSLTVTWTATDACNNTTVMTSTIDVTVDVTAPVLTVPAAALDLDCGDISETSSPAALIDAWLAEASATDACDADPVLSHDFDGGTLDVCAAADYSITVTWTAEDGCGNSSTNSQVINIMVDDVNPVFDVAPMDLTLDCGDINETTGTTLSGWLDNVVASDNCDTDVTLTHDYTATALNVCTGSGSPLTVTWTATDACGNFTTATAILTVTPDDAPPFFTTAPEDITFDCGEINETTAVTISGWLNNVVAEDLCDTDVVLTHDYTTTSLDVCTGAGSPLTVTWTATDACNNVTTATAILTITPDTAAPTFDVEPQDLTLDCGDINETTAVTLSGWLNDVSVSDMCDTDVVLTHDYTETTLDLCAGGTTTVTWTATDACNNVSTRSAVLTITPDTAPPTLTVPAAPLALDCGSISETSSPAALIDAWLAEATAVDACDTDATLTHNFDMGTLDVCAAADYSITVTWTASDACDNSITGTQTIDITVDATAPVVTPPASITLDCDDISDNSSPAAQIDDFLASYTVTDACDEDPVVTHDFDMTMLNVCAAADYDITVTFTAVDACNNSSTATAIISIDTDNEAPTLAGGLNPTEECDDFGGNNDIELQDWLADNGGFTATDACSDFLTWTNDFDPVTSWTAACGNTGLYTVNFTVSDECGNNITGTSTFTITDVTAPVFTNCPAPDVVEDAPAGWCAAFANFSLPEAIDNCANPTVTQIDGTGLSSGSLFPVGTTILTWQAEDDCGNTSLCTRKIVVNDYHTPPEIFVSAIDTVENDPMMCGAVVNGIAPDSIYDNCPDHLVVTYSITGPDGDLLECGFDDASGFKFPVGTSTVEYNIQDQNLLLISEVNQSGATDQIEITNFGPADLDISCLVINRTASNPAADETFVVPAATIVPAGGVYVHDLAFNGGAAMPACYTIFYGNNNYDEVCVNGNTGTNFTGIIGGGDAYRNTVCDTDDAIDWTVVDACNPANVGTYNPGLPTAPSNGNSTSLQSEAASTDSGSIVVTVIDTENPFCAELLPTTYTPAATPAVINDNTTCTTVDVTVPVNYFVGDVNIINMAGTYADMGALTFKLSSPNGTTITLFDGLCAGAADFNLGLDSDNTNSVALAPCGPLGQGGTFAPVESLKDFFGENALGVWTLEITSSAADAGSLTNFELEVNELADYSQMDETLANDPGVCGADFTWVHPVHGDNCCVGSITVAYTTDDGINVPTGGPITGGDDVTELFEVGTTTVTYTLTDAAGNVGTCSFDVTVEDVELPVAICPADISVGLDGGECEQQLFFPLDGTDNCSIDSIWSVPPPGSFFDIGVHTVTVFVLDPAGNAAQCSFNITVNEFPNPAGDLACNNDLNVSLDPNCELCVGADMILEGSAHGCFDDFTVVLYECEDANCPPIATSPCLGLEHVNQHITAVVTAPNGNSCMSTFFVEDKLFPEIECPADISVKCNASTEPSATGTPTLLSCEISTTQEYEDVFTDLGQCNDPRATIERTWTVTDESGNSSTCVQMITIERFDLADLTFPANLDDLDEASLECSDVIDNPALTHPTNTGEPMINGESLAQGGLCGYSTNVTEEVYEICGNGSSYEIFRTWKVRDLCQPIGPGNPVEHVQVIRVIDSTAPEIEGCSSGITMSIDGSNCLVIIDPNENGPEITDECSGVASVTVVSSTGSFELPVGNHVLTYTAVDNCGNVATCEVPVEVIDGVVPVAICESVHEVSLNNINPVIVYAATFDDGSYDACSDITFDVRRMTPPSSCIDFDWTTNGAGIDQLPNGIVDAKDQGTTFWYPAVPFSCCDVGAPVLVEFRVTDDQGNSNTCMVSVNVEDKLDPIISCPDNATYSCSEYINESSDIAIDGLNQDGIGAEAFYVDLNGPGNADNDTTFVGYYEAAFDNCDVTVYIRDAGTLNNCGVTAPFINRFYTAIDGEGRTDVCVQRLTVVNDTPFAAPNFPSDRTLTNCDDIGDPDQTGEPTFNDNTCSIVAVAYEDLVLPVVADACIKIQRTWTVHEECSDMIWTDIQIIKIINSEAPEFVSCEAPDDFCINSSVLGNCLATVSLSVEATDDCTTAEDMNYTYWVDRFNDGVADFPVSQNSGNTNTFNSNNMEVGTHKVTWTAEDGCGNITTCEYLIEVKDCDGPTVYADGITVDLAQASQADVWATDLNAGSFDNCSDICDYRIGVPSGGSGQTVPPTADNYIFDCDDLDQYGAFIEVDLWAKDCANNWSYTTVTVELEDNSDLCGPSVNSNIAGTIETETGAGVNNVTVDLSSNAPGVMPSATTGPTGAYAFLGLGQNFNYTVTPDMDLDPLNGVSTFDIVLMSRHILQLELLDSPYKMIAADVNLSGSITTFDMVELRKLILFIETEFPVESSTWRFVEADYVFSDPSNPWTAIFPEETFINGLTEDEIADFVAIKKGDVNGTASTSFNGDADSRDFDGELLFELDNRTLTAGQSYTVDFNANEFNNLLGYQFSLNYDMGAVEITDVQAGALEGLSASNFGMTKLSEGVITTSWNNNVATTLKDGATVFSVSFTAKQDMTMDEVFFISSVYTQAEAYNERLDLMEVGIRFVDDEEVTTAGEFALYQNQPNPFSDETVIRFSLPEDADVELTIYDVSGKVVKAIEGSYSKGLQEVSIDYTDLNGQGVYYYELKTDSDVANKEMILIN